jgi:hypothetical protein
MASPHVAGVVALALTAGITDVRSQLQSTATDLGAAGRDSWYGYGLVNADLAAPGATPPPPPPPPNAAPTVSISSPIDGSSFEQGTSVTLTGSANDAEDGNLSASISWSSSIDGGLGTGSSVSTSSLSVGTHTVTASVSDNGGLSATASVSVTITAPPPPPPPPTASVSVSSISYSTKGGNKHLVTTVSLESQGNPVSGAVVAVSITNGSNTASLSGTTGSNGSVSFQWNNAPSGTYTTTVTSVSASGLTWDGVTPTNSYTK